jgi:hypothetical protein
VADVLHGFNYAQNWRSRLAVRWYTSSDPAVFNPARNPLSPNESNHRVANACGRQGSPGARIAPGHHLINPLVQTQGVGPGIYLVVSD